MEIFVSYSRFDEDVVKALTIGLEAGGLQVWRDHALHGGDSWWSIILEQIRNCSVFVFALSDSSWHRSKPCQAELGYAEALDRPIVPVKVGAVAGLRAMPISRLQIVEYQAEDATTGFAVQSAITRAAARAVPLPDPLPDPPSIPYAYLLALSSKIEVGGLASDEQMRIIDDLRRALEEEHEEAVRSDIVRMLIDMRGRDWTVVRADREIEDVLTRAGRSGSRGPTVHTPPDLPVRRREPAATGPPPGWYADPARRHEWRWFDQDWTRWTADAGRVTEDPL